MQLLVMQFTIKILHIGFMQVLTVDVEISMFTTSCCPGMYITGQQDGNISIQTVYTATAQTDIMRNYNNKMILAHFIINRTILIF
jgi:hypothetical protein